MARLISDKVRVIDLNCSYRSKQAGADRYDLCRAKVRVEYKKKNIGGRVYNNVIDSPEDDLTYNIGTVFVGTYPEVAWKEAGEFKGISRVKLVIR